MAGDRFLCRTVSYVITAFAVAFFLSIATAGMAEAKEEKIPDDFTMTATGDSAPVVISHKNHATGKALKCTACHPKVFKMNIGKTAEKEGALTMAAMQEGKFCGKCHNGKESFDVKDEKECVKCHVKK